ncbi:hypothetical protein LOS78_14310 [Paracoccus sp. MA]|nr:hypothetical protein [Paracoccus sp. MA]UFM64844.1 hypothetical protein LOS78_14310 [Paracoccus sp. MA]
MTMARMKLTMMRYMPPGYGGTRRSPDEVKRDGWQEMGLLAVSLDDPRLTWPEREMVAQLGRKLYGPREGGRGDG